jgi:hypothetical protein
MEISIILLLSFVVLVGLEISVPDGDIEKSGDDPSWGCPWTSSPALKYFYIWSGIIGWLFVIIMAVWLSIAENWWYFLVYVAGLPLSKIAALILQIPLALVNPYFAKDPTDLFKKLRVKRIVGTLLILCSIIACILYLRCF